MVNVYSYHPTAIKFTKNTTAIQYETNENKAYTFISSLLYIIICMYPFFFHFYSSINKLGHVFKCQIFRRIRCRKVVSESMKTLPQATTLKTQRDYRVGLHVI